MQQGEEVVHTPSHLALQNLYVSGLPEDKSLYHYTDAGGLYGIAHHQKLWLTSLHYLNDSQEYYYAFDLLKQIIEQEYPGMLDEKQLEIFGKGMSGIFTFSLTEEKDLLSQWRGYCPNGGYSLSFDKSKLNRIVSDKSLQIAQCIYDKNIQRNFLIDNIIRMTPSQYMANANLSGGSRGSAGAQIAYLTGRQVGVDMAWLAPVFKHPSFSQEKEWRIIKVLDYPFPGSKLSGMMGNQRYQNMVSNIAVRISKNKIIPYLEFSFNYNGVPMNFEEIVVGPNAHPELSKDACRVLANIYDKTQYHQTSIINSEIPYVNW